MLFLIIQCNRFRVSSIKDEHQIKYFHLLSYPLFPIKAVVSIILSKNVTFEIKFSRQPTLMLIKYK